MNITQKDIPFLPGTVFADPKKADYKKAHVLDKTATSVACRDEKALLVPQGVTQNPLCARNTIAPAAQAAQELSITGHQKPEGMDPAKITQRAPIACRKGMITEPPANAPVVDLKDTFNVKISRDHDVERAFAKTVKPFRPDFVKLDGAVLRFYAWYGTEVQESQQEKLRIRHVIIDYIQLDNTIIVFERPIANSGHLQGELLKRQRVPLDWTDKGSRFLVAADLKVQHSVNMFGTVYNVYACSADTRKYFEQEKVEMPADVPQDDVPTDQYTEQRAGRHKSETTKDVVTKHVPDDPLAKYLRHDREVLNFFAYWDSRDAAFGEVRYFTVQYFLADDCMQVLEVLPSNSGRDPFPQFIRRSKFPKRYKQTTFSEHAEATQEFYTARDIKVGEILDVFNRQFFIYDADQFTKTYMLKEFGYREEDVKPRDSKQQQIVDRAPTIRDPETLQSLTRLEASKLFHEDVHQIGSEEDTLGSCMSVHPIPPKRNVVRWMKYGDLALKFVVKFAAYRGKPVHITNIDRRFLLSYYLADDSLSIFEAMGETNAGFGARFKERGQLLNVVAMEKQDADEYGRGKGAVYYNFKDLKVGTIVEVAGTAMEIIEADSRTRKILEGLEKFGNDAEKFDPEGY